MEERGGGGGPQTPEAGAGGEQLVKSQGGVAGIGGEGDVGQAVGDGNADLRAGGVEIGLGLADIGALRHELRGQAEWEFGGELQAGEIELGGGSLVRKMAGQHGEEVAQLGGLFDQRREQGGGLRERRFLGDEIQTAGVAFGVLISQDFDHVGIEVDELMGGIDLRLNSSQFDCGHNHIGGERGVGGDHLEADALFRRLHRFHGAAVRAEDVGRIGDADLRGEQIILEVVGAGRGGDGARLFLAAGGETGRHARIINTALGEHVFVGHGQGRLRRLEVGIIGEGGFDEFVEWDGMEQGPPVGGKIAVGGEVLGITARDVRGGDGGGARGIGEAGFSSDGRSFEIGAYRATGK